MLLTRWRQLRVVAWTEPQSLREGPANAETPPVGGTERPQGLRVQSKGKIGGWVKGTGGSTPPPGPGGFAGHGKGLALISKTSEVFELN